MTTYYPTYWAQLKELRREAEAGLDIEGGRVLLLIGIAEAALAYMDALEDGTAISSNADDVLADALAAAFGAKDV